MFEDQLLPAQRGCENVDHFLGTLRNAKTIGEIAAFRFKNS